MRILYLITKSNFGGAQRYVYDLATYTKEHGHDVMVGLGGNGTLKDKLAASGIPTYEISSLSRDVNIKEDLRAFFSLWKLIRTFRPEVIHLNSSKIGALGGVLARISNAVEHLRKFVRKDHYIAVVIFTGHGWTFNEERSDAERTFIGLIHWITIMLSSATIAVSQKTKDQIANLPLVGRKITTIHNGIPPFELLSRDEALSQIFLETPWDKVTDERLTIGTISELHKNKGLMYALDGISRLHPKHLEHIRFIIIGEEGDERKHLEDSIRALGLASTVLIAGRRKEAWKLLSAFDIFLLSSITEAFPYAILEAGAAGLPIIATSVGGIPEVIDDMNSGVLIHSRNSGEIARAITFLLEEPKRRRAFASAIKKKVTSSFSLEQMCTKTLALYQAQSKKSQAN